MSSQPPEILVRAWARLTKAQQLVLRQIERSLKDAGLPPLSWYDVLLEVERNDAGLRPFELERAMLLPQYNLSRLIDRIENAGYVERLTCEEDGRGQLIAITAAGRAIRRKMWPVYARAVEDAVGRHLSTVQADHLGTLLKLLIDGHHPP